MAARSQAGGPFWDLGHLPPTLPEQDPGTAGTWRDRRAWDGARAGHGRGLPSLPGFRDQQQPTVWP